jgi:hypothetical protein
MSVVTFAHFSVILSIRDPRLLRSFDGVIVRNNDYDGTRFLCDQLPTCFRFASPLLGDIVYLGIRFFDSVYTGATLSFHNLITNVQRENFLIFMGHFIYPIIAFLFCFLLVIRVLKSITSALLFLNVFFFLLSGQVIIWLSKVISFSGVVIVSPASTQRLVDGLVTFPTMYFVFYDYSALVVICVSIWFLASEKAKNISLFSKFLIGAVSTAFFENLGFVLFIAICWIDWRRDKSTYLKRNFPVALGSGLLIVAVQLRSGVGKGGEGANRSLASIWEEFFSSNVSSAAAVLISLFLLLGLPIVLGSIFGAFVRRTGIHDSHLEFRLRHSIEGYSLGLALSVFAGFFTSGLSSEAGRQTLGLQFLFFLVATLGTTRQSLNKVRCEPEI